MRPLITITLFFISAFSFSQKAVVDQKIISDSGKNEFKAQAKKDTADYSKAYRILKNQITLNPDNAELRYFLGYTIDRMNAEDGAQMFKLTKEMTIKASEQFEEVNILEPFYKGELFILDPYAKLTSIWGSLAEAYLYRSLIDSAKWAFSEGKKRGGFIEPALEFNRQLLNSCNKNSILISYGDNITFPIWYLQTIENYRADITAIDANLINSTWYPKYLKKERKLKLSLSDEAMDTIEYQQWKPQMVSVVNPKLESQKFSWELRPTYKHCYILRGDRILLDIVQQNFYNRPIYFSNHSDSTYNLFLSSYLADEGLAKRVTSKIINDDDTVVIPQNLYKYNILNIKADEIAKSSDAIIVLNNFRLAFINVIYGLASQGKYQAAKKLFDHMNKNFTKKKLPFTAQEAENYFEDFYQKLVNRSQ